MNIIDFKNQSFYLFLFLIITGCSTDKAVYETLNSTPLLINEAEKKIQTIHYDNQGFHDHNYVAKTNSFLETFESGIKDAYSGDAIGLSSGDWYLEDVLLGENSNDRKYGSKSLRIRNGGYGLMNFDMDNGAESVTVRHAVYGNDGDSSWYLIASYDEGASWYFLSSEITTTSTSLNTVTFLVEDTQSVRYGIYKSSNDPNRLNIDNIEITIVGGTATEATQDSNLTFGNPSNADDVSDDNYFLQKDDFTLSYNNSKGTANWVSWHLSSAWTGGEERCDCFKVDVSLPDHFYKPATSDYTNTGFDRGHICPSADRDATASSNENTYYMSNIAPQAPDNNRLTWANFEAYLRELTEEGNEIHIIAGVYAVGGEGSNGYFDTIDSGQITVPESFWKVALVLPNGSSDISRVNTTTRIIAISVPNEEGISSDWTDFITSVDEIEDQTGYDLFENIPDSIASIIESNFDEGLDQ